MQNPLFKKHCYLLALLPFLLLFSCNEKSNTGDKPIIENEETLLAEPDAKLASPSGVQLSFSAYPPKDVAANATPEQLIQFAWDEFIALTWKSSYSSDGKRDNPDQSWSWNNYTGAYPDLVVWETYAHRTELRPANAHPMQNFDAAPVYTFEKQPLPANPQANFQLFNNLDENNEIGSCNLYAHYKKYQKTNQVLYQAKVNRDEYDYIKQNYPNSSVLLAATTKTLNNIKQYNAYYQGATSTCNCPDTEGVICLPCGGSPIPGGTGTYTGAMEIKTAWRKLTPEDNPADFFVRNAIYYEDGQNGGTTYNNGDFALIGIHIIHKTTNYPDFIFATWEHVGVEGDDMAYELLDGSNTIVDDYKRFHPIPAVVDKANKAVHAQMKAKNPNTIWQNYRLVGVQGAPTNDTTSFSYFLANYVIESDPALADFHGSGVGAPFDGGVNILSNGQRLTMGGCKGCHGVAQITLGTDFSFLLDTVGKPVPEPDILGPLPARKVAMEKLSALELVKATTQEQ